MTKKEETRLLNLSHKQGFETLNSRETREILRLAAKKASEKKKGRSSIRITVTPVANPSPTAPKPRRSA